MRDLLRPLEIPQQDVGAGLPVSENDCRCSKAHYMPYNSVQPCDGLLCLAIAP